MHLAPLVRRVVVGGSVLACYLAAALPASAWNPFSRSADQRPAAKAGDQRPHAMQGGGIAQQPQKRAPLFQGQEIRLPEMPFARSKPAAANVPPNTQGQFAQRPAARAAEPTAQRFATPPAATVPQAPRPMAYTPLAVPMKHSPDARQHMPQVPLQSQQALQARGEMTGQPRRFAAAGDAAAMAVERPLPAITQQSKPATAQQLEPAKSNPPQPAERLASSPEAAVAPPEEQSATPAVAAASPPTSPADRLVAQAHEWTASAKSETDFTRIIDTCRRVRANRPAPATARYANELASWAFNRRGQLRAEAGREKEAIADFDDAIRADPQRWRPIHNRGVLLAQTGEFERAFDDFTRTIQLNPDFAKAYSNRAALLVVAGDLQTALADYRRAVELDPQLAVAHRGLGRTCHLLGKLEEALTHYDEAVRLAPDDAYAVVSRADLLTDLGNYADAIAEYERTIKMNPKSSHAYSSSAWLLATCPDASIRNGELAIERAKKAIEMGGSKDAVAYDTLAAAHANAGDFSAALHTVRQAVLLAPPEEREVYEERLLNYQHARPYRIAPIGAVLQASYTE